MVMYEMVRDRYEWLARNIMKQEKYMKNWPSIEIFLKRNRDDYSWYILDRSELNSKKIYLPKSEEAEARKLAFITLQKARLNDMKQELLACERFLKVYCKQSSDYPEYVVSKEASLMLNEGFVNLLSKNTDNPTVDWQKWQFEDYPNGKDYYPSQLNVRVTNNLYVRSKSERSIALTFLEAKKPFRYEWRLEMGNIWVLPDFAAPNKQGEIIFLEHLGMVDKPGYIDDLARKLKNYMQFGIYLGVNLFFTSETGTHPFDIAEARELIRKRYL